MREWAKSKGLMEKSVRARLFGRNTYPTDKPEPHGYEFYLTVDHDIEPEGDIETRDTRWIVRGSQVQEPRQDRRSLEETVEMD